MRKLFGVILLTFLFLGTFAQNILPCPEDLRLNSADATFSSFVNSIKVEKSDDYHTAKILFKKAHKQFLRSYKSYSQIKDVFAKGNYDCLSGTYFLASALDELHLKYKVMETNCHIFLLVKTKKGDVLMECSDPINGFTFGAKKINDKINFYKSHNSDKKSYLAGVNLFHELLPGQLTGILYFNRAVEAFNKNELKESGVYLDRSRAIYDNPRIEFFTPILLDVISKSGLDQNTKDRLAFLLKSHQSLQTIAHR